MPSMLDMFDRLSTTPDKPERKTKQQVSVDAKSFIKGDFAKSQAGTLGSSSKSMSEMFDQLSKPQGLTGGNSRPMPLLNQDEVKSVVKSGQSMSQLFDQSSNETPAFTSAVDDPHTGVGFSKTALTLFSLDEHSEVWAARKLLGFPTKADFSENTFTNLIQDMGAPKDSPWTTGAGIVLSIFGSLGTYLTGGIAAEGKIALKGATKGAAATANLNKKGIKLLQTMTKDTGEAMIAEINAKRVERGMTELTNKQRNKVIDRAYEQNKKILINKFQSIKDASKGDFSQIPSDIFDKGGVKLFGHTMVSGESIAKSMLPVKEAMDVMFIKKPTTAFFKGIRETIDPITSNFLQFKDWVGKGFIVKYKYDKDLIETQLDTLRLAREYKLRIQDSTENFLINSLGLKHESDAIEFGKVMNKASTIPDKITDSSFIKNEVVRNAFDKWHGIGAYSGKKTLKDRIAKRLGLSDELENPNWWPGVSKHALAPTIQKYEKGVSFIEREINDPSYYTNDPFKALTYRRLSIAYDELNEKMYKALAEKKIGTIPGKPGELFLDGYTAVRPPVRMTDPDLNVFAKEPIWVRDDLAKQYQDLTTIKNGNIPFLSYATNLFKRNVTAQFPAFHAKNYLSNVIFNSYQIGRHSLDFSLNAKAFKLARAGVKKEMSGDLGELVQANKLLLGVGEKDIFTTKIGKKFSNEELLNLARREGLIGYQDFKADAFGEMVGDKVEKNLINTIWRRINPLSPEFLTSPEGQKLGNIIETQAKMVNFLHWIREGLDPKIAAKMTQDALFDYGDITNFEKYAKQVIPFYVFNKKNVQAHLKLLATKPGVITAQMKFFRDLGPTEKDFNALPQWAKNNSSVKLFGKFYTGFGIPLDSAVQMTDPKEVLSMTSPVIRWGVEKFITGRDFRSDREIISINNANEFKPVYDLARNKNIPGPIREIFATISENLKLEVDNHGKLIGDPNWLHILRNSFTSRWQSTIGFIEKKDQPWTTQTLRLMTGIMELPQNIQLQASIINKEKFDFYRKKVLETGAGREGGGMPYFYGGDPTIRDITNILIQLPMDAKQLKEKVGVILEERQTQRTKVPK